MRISRFLYLGALVLPIAGISYASLGQTRAAPTDVGTCSSSQSPSVISNIYLNTTGIIADAVPVTAVSASATPTAAPAVGPAEYGFVEYAGGLSPAFQAGTRDQSSALFTFFTTASTTQDTQAGSTRTLSRTGTTTIYLVTGAGGNFARPDSFRSGTPIQVSTLNQTITSNSANWGFTTSSLNQVTSVTPFTLGGTCYQLGSVGQLFSQTNAGRFKSQTSLTGTFTGLASGGSTGQYKAILLGANEANAAGQLNQGDPFARGSATVSLSASLGLVCYSINISGIVLPATASHIHQGAAGVAGPIVVPFTAPNAAGVATGCTSGVSPTLINSIEANPSGFYVNVHNSVYPGGAARGQLY